jgi:hypothetical protein
MCSAMSAAAGLLGRAPLQNLQSVRLTRPLRSAMDPSQKRSTFACCICRVLVTAPLRVLQTGGIRFQPPLPPRKQVLPVSCCLRPSRLQTCAIHDAGAGQSCSCTACSPFCIQRGGRNPQSSHRFCIQPGAGTQAAMGRLRMGSAVKVLLGFSHPGAASCLVKTLSCSQPGWLCVIQACTSVGEQLLRLLPAMRPAHRDTVKRV